MQLRGDMVQLRRAATDEDFRAVHGLVAEMGLWDVAECDRLRIDSSEVLPTYYADDPERLRAKFTAPSCGMFLALRGGEALGCAGHLRDGAAQEVTKLFVRPAARGLRLGRTLLAAVIASARPTGGEAVRLVTISFMEDAIRLYRSFGFTECPPFAPAPDGLAAETLYMELPHPERRP